LSYSDDVNLADQAWLNESAARRVINALEEGPETVRFVGGCVRDAVRGDRVKDVDLATVHPPSKIIELLEACGVKAVPTGIDHGTITAVSDGKPFEVTTLRTDVRTFGRRAEVVFIEDWLKDAERRDFTMNAIYADPDGRVFDPVAGVADARAGLVRFVGDPDQRIQEDYLRILRFFRFNARFGYRHLDAQSLAACVCNKAGLSQLSGERIQSELFQLLATDAASPVLREMDRVGVLADVIPKVEARQLDVFDGLIAVERDCSLDLDLVLRLAVLLPGQQDALKNVAQRLKFSNEVRDRLLLIVRSSPINVEEWHDERQMRRILYRLGQVMSRDILLLRWAEDYDPKHKARWHEFLYRIKAWSKPILKIKAKDVMRLGVEAGPDVGRALTELEDWWIDQDFPDNRTEQLNQLKRIVLPDN